MINRFFDTKDKFESKLVDFNVLMSPSNKTYEDFAKNINEIYFNFLLAEKEFFCQEKTKMGLLFP